MRVLLLISPESPALAGLTPILATLIARGATVEAGPAAPHLRAESIHVTEHADAAVDQSYGLKDTCASDLRMICCPAPAAAPAGAAALDMFL
jgi:hypothetical protein